MCLWFYRNVSRAAGVRFVAQLLRFCFQTQLRFNHMLGCILMPSVCKLVMESLRNHDNIKSEQPQRCLGTTIRGIMYFLVSHLRPGVYIHLLNTV